MNTKEMIAVMQAHAKGKAVQVRAADYAHQTWGPCATPLWNWRDFEYRVKPLPRYLNVYAEVPRVSHWHDTLASLETCRSAEVCIGYLEDKQDGSVPVFHPLKS